MRRKHLKYLGRLRRLDHERDLDCIPGLQLGSHSVDGTVGANHTKDRALSTSNIVSIRAGIDVVSVCCGDVEKVGFA